MGLGPQRQCIEMSSSLKYDTVFLARSSIALMIVCCKTGGSADLLTASEAAAHMNSSPHTNIVRKAALPKRTCKYTAVFSFKHLQAVLPCRGVHMCRGVAARVVRMLRNRAKMVEHELQEPAALQHGRTCGPALWGSGKSSRCGYGSNNIMFVSVSVYRQTDRPAG